MPEPNDPTDRKTPAEPAVPGDTKLTKLTEREVSEPAVPARHVFVYGTLRRGGSNDITRLQPSPVFAGTARVAGLLYHLGAYPGLVLGGDQWVHGEVYAIDAALEAILDEIEDLGPNPTDEYVKREIQLEVDGKPLTCLLYEMNLHHIRDAPCIAHGDWLTCLEAPEESRDAES